MKNAKFIVVLLIAVTGFAYSCKKKKGVGPLSVKIAFIDQVHAQSVIRYRVVYDALNNVDSIVSIGGGTDTGHNGYKKFDYHPTSYTVTDESSNYFTVWINSDGSLLEVLTTDTIFMKYSSSQLFEVDIKSPSATYPYYTFAKTNYYWQNGDINILVTSAANDTVDYDNSRGGQQGDAMRIDQFLSYGQSYTKTAHVPKDLVSNGIWIQRYFYQYDGGSRITQFMKVQNNHGSAPDDTLVYNYRY